MIFNSVRDILLFAISREQASSDFYYDLSLQMANTSTKAIFEVLSKEEIKHAKSLEFELLKQGYTIPTRIEVDDSMVERWQGPSQVDEG